MPDLAPQSTPEGNRARTSEAAGPPEYPVREYICGMASELAQMARWDGDEALGGLLDGVAEMAAQAPAGRSR